MRPRPQCIACGSAGREIYAGLKDRLFEAPGEWRLARCPAPACGVMCLDPMPLEDDLPRAYHGYFTHREPASVPRRGRLARTVRRGYLALRYGARHEHGSPFERLTGLALYARPLGRIDVDASLMFLPVIARGRIVDVGCARGDLLRSLAEAGWRAEGTDPDGEAVALARARGLDARVGTLADHAYPTGTFDAMTMSHVIEHVPDPTAS